MLKHEYIEYRMKNGIHGISIIFEDEKYEILGVFLLCEISAFYEWAIELFDKVLSGESKYESFTGNACTAEISPKTTKIFDALADDGMGHWCEVDTKELRMLIDEWHEKKSALKD